MTNSRSEFECTFSVWLYVLGDFLLFCAHQFNRQSIKTGSGGELIELAAIWTELLWCCARYGDCDAIAG